MAVYMLVAMLVHSFHPRLAALHNGVACWWQLYISIQAHLIKTITITHKPTSVLSSAAFIGKVAGSEGNLVVHFGSLESAFTVLGGLWCITACLWSCDTDVYPHSKSPLLTFIGKNIWDGAWTIYSRKCVASILIPLPGCIDGSILDGNIWCGLLMRKFKLM
jgi:hypothetical protein